ncbi:transposase IS3 [Klebsiella michiganensis]|nr:transposase IS3 [Klebsiella michiganensis]
MTKPVSTSKKPRKQHTPEFRNEALKLAQRIGVAAAARELSLYESQLYAWRSKLKMHIPLPSVSRKWRLKLAALSGNWRSRQRS